MKIYPSWAVLLYVVPFLIPVFLFLPLRDPDLDYFTLEWAARSAGIAVIILAACSPVLLIPTGVVHSDRLRISRGRGPGAWHVLGAGERFVICRDAVQVQRPDGSLQRTGLTRRTAARRSWRRIERWLPTLDVA
jgi:hypothetical protein